MARKAAPGPPERDARDAIARAIEQRAEGLPRRVACAKSDGPGYSLTIHGLTDRQALAVVNALRTYGPLIIGE